MRAPPGLLQLGAARLAAWPWWAWALLACAVVAVLAAAWATRRAAAEPEPDVEKAALLEDPGPAFRRDPVPRRSAIWGAAPPGARDHGELQENFDAEQVSKGETPMFTFSQMGMSKRHKKMLHYDVDRATGWSALFSLGGTLLTDAHLWRTCAVYWVACAGIALMVLWRGSTTASILHNQAAVDELKGITRYLAALLGFMLALFVSEIISRWWRCRIECLEVLWAALNDLNMLLAMYCLEPGDRGAKETVLRLTLLVHRLVYCEARDTEGAADLVKLRDVGLLKPDELAALVDQPAKSQQVLVWAGRVCQSIGKKKRWDAEIEMRCTNCITSARHGIGRVFAYCQTQLPFQYVHLLSFCVLLSNMLCVLKCALEIGDATLSSPVNWPRIWIQSFEVLVEPFAYHAFLRLCSELSNPFGHDFSDFPGFAYHCYMRAEGCALMRAGEDLPQGLMDLKEEIER